MAYRLDDTTKFDITDSIDTASHNIRESVEETYHEKIGTHTNVFLTKTRVYIAGILVPTIAINISCAFDQTPSARITIPADPRLYNLGKYDRVPVQVFVKETFVEAPGYILMFEGYIASRSYISVPNQREINLECLAFTEVFNDVKLQFMTSLEGTLAYHVPGNKGIAQGVFRAGFIFPMCLFFQGMGLRGEDEGTNDTPPMITRPTDYLVNLIQYMEEAGTAISPLGRYNDSIVSKYFATLAYNLHFDRRFCWLPYFDTQVDESYERAKKQQQAQASGTSSTSDTSSTSNTSDTSDDPAINWAWEAEGIEIDDPLRGGETVTMFPVLYGLKTEAAKVAIASSLQTCSKEFTIADLLKFLVNEMEYDFLVIPNPAYHEKSSEDDEGLAADENRAAVLTDEEAGITPSSTATEVVLPRDEKSPIDSDSADHETMAANIRLKYSHDRNCRRMVNFCLKPMFDDTFPPQCNVIFRSQVSSIQTHQKFSGTPTRIQVTNFNSFLSEIAKAGGSSETITQFGTVDFYPSQHYGKIASALGTVDVDKDAGESIYDASLSGADEYTRALISSELLEVERHTGPWIHRDRAPSWMTYAFNYAASQAGTDTDNTEEGDYTVNDELTYGPQLQIKKMREQYMRRQLMRAQILSKQLQAECTFLPYLTCGFPAVIYDSSDSGFSFAGNVISYEHNITENSMTTSVMMNGVRLLAEAVKAEANGLYPNPINSVHAVTHNQERLARVYNMILGTPDIEVSGAVPITWADVKKKYSAEITDVSTSPQTNIYEAYKLQRRNVINFDDYCTFMGFTKNSSGDDESGSPPTELQSKWLENRAKIVVYGPIPLAQTILPVDEAILRKNEIETVSAKKTELEQANANYEEQIAEYEQAAVDKEASLTSAVSEAQAKVSAEGGNTEANQQALAAAQSALSDFNSNGRGGYDSKIANLKSKITENTAEIATLSTALDTLNGATTSAEKNQGFTSDGTSTDVRALLKEIYTQETANNIY